MDIIVRRSDGSRYSAKSCAQFNGGYSHIIIDDGCYQIVNGDGISSHIFPEALEILKTLPLDIKGEGVKIAIEREKEMARLAER